VPEIFLGAHELLGGEHTAFRQISAAQPAHNKEFSFLVERAEPISRTVGVGIATVLISD
jgi:hypothetical protein